MKPRLVADITNPVARPRSSMPNRSAISANPTTHVMASAAPWTNLATNNAVRPFPNANISVAAARTTSPPTIGVLRPTRSDTAPIGIETVRSVTPKDANRKPMSVGDAPSRRVRSGRTGTAIEYATMSANVANAIRTSAVERERRIVTRVIVRQEGPERQQGLKGRSAERYEAIAASSRAPQAVAR
jgi:hypothetical protein